MKLYGQVKGRKRHDVQKLPHKTKKRGKELLVRCPYCSQFQPARLFIEDNEVCETCRRKLGEE